MTSAGAKRKGLAAVTTVLGALVGICLVVAAPAFAESSDSAAIRPLADGGLGFPSITGPTAPEEYPFELGEPSPEIKVRQIGDQEVIGEYIEGGYTAWTIEAEPAHDAVGATVPTTLKLAEEDIVTLTVHYRAGNPAAGGAPFVFPITEGKGWEGGWFFGIGEHSEEPQPTPDPPPPTPTCAVPHLHGLSLRAAKASLHAADCSLGRVHLGRGATKAKGKIVKQFHPAGAQLEAGAPVAVKLGSR